jgi:hypothetical protein
MKRVRQLSWLLLIAAITAGSLVVTTKTAPIAIGGYRVLSADFHNHTFPGDWALVAPWDAVLIAQHDHLDVISLAGQNHIWKGRVATWFAKQIDGPVVFTGEEIVSPHYHMLAVGIDQTVSWRQSAAASIEEIHRQGGVAIAAHPVKQYWPAYDARAMQLLDAAEIVHPGVRTEEGFGAQLRAFALRGHPAAIGDSDWRFGPMGWCRTFVFAREASEQGVLEAIREHRTVVYDRGNWFGDPQLIELAKKDGRLAYDVVVSSDWLSAFSRIAGSLALLGLIFTVGRSHRQS